jgi:Tfp pilus assembly protein PilV
VRAPGKRGDRGESLIEVLVSVAIMGTAVVALVGGLATAILMSDTHRKQAQAGVYVRAYAEAIETAVAASPTSYVDCATKASYESLFASPAGFDREVVSVTYWSSTAFTSGTCTTDQGVQRVALRVWSADGRASERLDVVIRKPCRSTLDFPQDTPCT